MLFSVIYSVDVPEDTAIENYVPPQVEDLWQETEGDDQRQYDYLEGLWENSSHRKWCASSIESSSTTSFHLADFTPRARKRWAVLVLLVSDLVGHRPSASRPAIRTQFNPLTSRHSLKPNDGSATTEIGNGFVLPFSRSMEVEVGHTSFPAL